MPAPRTIADVNPRPRHPATDPHQPPEANDLSHGVGHGVASPKSSLPRGLLISESVLWALGSKRQPRRWSVAGLMARARASLDAGSERQSPDMPGQKSSERRP